MNEDLNFLNHKSQSAEDSLFKLKVLIFLLLILNLSYLVLTIANSLWASLIEVPVFIFTSLYIYFGIWKMIKADKLSIHKPFSCNLYKFTSFLYAYKTNNDVFKPISSDWQEEYFDALNNEEIWKARWINVRYTYEFLSAMWQKSPIGYLIEFIIKLALRFLKL